MECLLQLPDSLMRAECWGVFAPLGGLCLLLFYIARWSYQCIEKINTFALFFIDHGPPGERIIDWGFPHIIQIGRHERWVQVIFNRGLTISRFNMRFVPTGSRPSDLPTNVGDIVQILEIYLGQQTDQIQAQISTMVNDQHGGIDIVLARAISIGNGRPLFLRLDLITYRAWIGRLSFQALDAENVTRDTQLEIIIQ